MKIRIEKNGSRIKLTVAYDTAKKPLVIDVTESELAGLMSMLDLARRTTTFSAEVNWS